MEYFIAVLSRSMVDQKEPRIHFRKKSVCREVIMLIQKYNFGPMFGRLYGNANLFMSITSINSNRDANYGFRILSFF